MFQRKQGQIRFPTQPDAATEFGEPCGQAAPVDLRRVLE
jgi:hypothetical protein